MSARRGRATTSGRPRGRPSLRGSGVAAIAGLLVLAAGWPPARALAQNATGAGPAVREVRFSGVRAFSPDSLRGAIVTQETTCRIPGILPPCWFGLLHERQELDANALQADVRRLLLFYHRRGYRGASVEADTSAVDDGVRVLFRIEEGRPVRVTELVVRDTANALAPDVRSRLPLAVGAPFNTVAHEAVRDTLRNRLHDSGYPHAQVLAGYFIPSDSPVARVRYTIVPGPRARFGDIEIVGANAVSPVVIRRMLSFEPGRIYRRNELLRSQRSLYGLGVFRHVEISGVVEPGAPDTLVPVRIQVNEGDIQRVRFGAGVNTLDAFNAEGRWATRNFLGGARRLEVSGRVANVLAKELHDLAIIGTIFEAADDPYGEIDGALSIDFTQPWFFDPRTSLNLGAFAERRSVPDVFVRTGQGGYLSVSRNIGRRTTLALGYRAERTELTAEGDLFFCVSYRACEANDIDVLGRPHWLAPVTLSFARDRSNSIFSPTDGYILRVDAEYGADGSGSDFAYSRMLAEASVYEDIASGWVLAGRVRSGLARLIDVVEGRAGLGLHPQKRFFAGGPNSVRGYGYYRLGPKVLTVDAAGVLAEADTATGWPGCPPAEINAGTCDATALAAASPDSFEVRPVGGAVVLEASAELRFPLWRDRLGGAAFVDLGQVWSREQDVDPGDIVFTPGVGVRYFSPVGPIRVDIAYNPPRVEEPAVITTKVCGDAIPCGGTDPDDGRLMNTNELVRLDRAVRWNPRRDSFFDRIRIHFSIGQAF